MEVAVTCAVCLKVYQQSTRDPLVLPCGHTFCRECLAAVLNISGRILCPNCRRDASISDVSKLPICYPLVSLSSSYSEIKVSTTGRVSSTARMHHFSQNYYTRKKMEKPRYKININMNSINLNLDRKPRPT